MSKKRAFACVLCDNVVRSEGVKVNECINCRQSGCMEELRGAELADAWREAATR